MDRQTAGNTPESYLKYISCSSCGKPYERHPTGAARRFGRAKGDPLTPVLQQIALPTRLAGRLWRR